MKYSSFKLLVTCMVIFNFQFVLGNPTTLLHYWNFNNNSTLTAMLTANTSIINGASIVFNPGPTSAIDLVGGTGQNFSVLNQNARNADVSGTHLRVNNPIGSELIFSIPTNAYKDISIRFTTRRSGSGAGLQYWSYSSDGITFTAVDTITVLDADPVMKTIDFSSITMMDNNPNAKVKVQFAAGIGSTAGNNRFDNFSIDGKLIPPYTLIHYWNFNNNASISSITQPSLSLIGNAGIVHSPGGTSIIDPAGGTSQNFSVLNQNARNADVSGTHLRFNNPIGGELIFSLQTVGYEDLLIKFATRRSGSGAGTQIWSYSTDGTNYVSKDTIIVADADPVLCTLSYVGITGANNNPNFRIKVGFLLGAGGTAGNNRFDNFTIEGLSLLGIDTSSPNVTITPLNNKKYIDPLVQPSLTFNEQVRLVDNSALTSLNIANAIELRQQDTLGAIIPFTASYINNIVTITPLSTLELGKKYFIGIIPNTLEDISNNPIVNRIGNTFTIIPPQTNFQAGDLLPIAYRMNAIATDDEIGLINLIDIIPETILQLTDSKVIQGLPTQCPGGITWISPENECIPAGSFISIKTEALTANKGLVSGSGFGLSSSGDQVIIYAGTNTNPKYITALSSNSWIASNSICTGSFSMIPPGLIDGQHSVSMASAPGNIMGNSVNAYYNGTQTGAPSSLKNSILNPENWIVSAAGTSPQIWPTYSFPGPPRVQSTSVLSSTVLRIIYGTNMDSVTVVNKDNYVGLPTIQTISVSDNGILPDTVLLTMFAPFVNNQTYTLAIQQVKNAFGQTMVCPYQYTFTYRTTIAFRNAFLSVSEGVGTLTIPVDIINPSQGSFSFQLMKKPFSTADSNDFGSFLSTFTITPTTNSVQISIPIKQDTIQEQHTEYATFLIHSLQNCALLGDSTINIFLRDDDRIAPKANGNLSIKHIASFTPSSVRSNSCEVVGYDSATQRLFTTSGVEGYIDIIDFSEPTSPKLIRSINMNSFGSVTSLAVKNGLLVVASPNVQAHLPGNVIALTLDGNPIRQFVVGAQPDMITFTPDGTKIIVANEGQPSLDYSIDPEGSISIIDISKGISNTQQSDVKTLDFTAFNSQSQTLIGQGIRKIKSSSTLSQDFEPEYITVDPNSDIAWLTLQENNAIAVIDLRTQQISSIFPIGTKDLSIIGNGIDASDNNQVIAIANWPIKAFYIPDAIANYSAKGKQLLVIANEGDEKEYGAFTERTTVGASTYLLDSTVFPQRNQLKKNHMLGRFRVTNVNGDKNGDGIFEEIYCVGARSFSIMDATTKKIIYDSGDDFEMITSSLAWISPIFNADNENNTLKGRSRAKGPEPEGVTIATIDGKSYAFTVLERIGGIMAYDITDPDKVQFVDYANSRSITSYSGDHGSETITFIPSTSHNKNRSYLVVANEISGTISIYEVVNNRFSPNIGDWGNADADGSSLPGKKHFGLQQQRYITQSDAQLIMKWLVNNNILHDSLKVDSLIGSNAYRADVNHNGRYYFSNRTPDNLRDTLMWKRMIDIGTDGIRLRNDSANILSYMPPDAGPLSKVYFEASPFDAALILHYLAGRVPTLPWLLDTIPSFGKVTLSQPLIRIKEIHIDEKAYTSTYAVFSQNENISPLSFSLKDSTKISLQSVYPYLYNSEIAYNTKSIHFAGSEIFPSSEPLITFSIFGSRIKSIPVIINDVQFDINIEPLTTSIKENENTSCSFTYKNDGIEFLSDNSGGEIMLIDYLGKKVFQKQHLNMITHISFSEIPSGIYQIIYVHNNHLFTEKISFIK